MFRLNCLGKNFIRFRAYILGGDLELGMNKVKFRTK